MMNKLFFFLVIILSVNYNISLAQPAADSTKQKKPADSVKANFVTRMQTFAKKSAKESADDFNADKAVIAQNKTFEDIKLTIQKAGLYLQNGIDTGAATKQLVEIEKDFVVAGDGVLFNQGSAQTFRNLTATSKIIDELLNKANVLKVRLETHHQNLINFRYQLDSLSSKSELFKFPQDSSILSKYLSHLVVVAYQVHPVDSTLKIATDNIQNLLNHANLITLKLQTSVQQINGYKASMATNSFKREFGNIWGATGYFRPLNEILKQAKAKGELTLIFYFQNNSFLFLIILLLICTVFIYLRSLKKIYIDDGLLDESFEGQLVLKHPLLSALIIIINLFQFIFFSPPFALNIILWTISALSLSLLFKNFIVRYWMNVWLIMLGLFLISAVDNVILQASREERWFMVFLALTGAFIGTIVSVKGRRDELREKWIMPAIGFMTILEAGSVIANVFGRYNLAKTLLISGYLNVVIAILFLWTVRMVNEGLFLAFNVYVQQDKKLFYLNFDKVGKKVPAYFYILLVIGWIILFGRNFAWFEHVAVPFLDFFALNRTIGDYTFSINKLLLFISIMAISVIISKIVSFFASDNHLAASKDDKNAQRGVGSWLLLIRITILSLGLFLAIAAAGIPVDRIAIILGALGVGIGFGLQTLVNNLVSGLIIAFEKPVNVGDVVEVDGQSGTMKSIGFRSSVILTSDGADVVMPNGDLLNSHLTNWTLGGSRKRVSILIGIAYDTNLQQAKDIIAEILAAEDRISKSSAPVIQYEQFNHGSIDVRIYFWARHMKDAPAIKSDLIMAINAAFATHNIVIPFPQQDIYLHRLAKIAAETNDTKPKKHES